MHLEEWLYILALDPEGNGPHRKRMPPVHFIKSLRESLSYGKDFVKRHMEMYVTISKSYSPVKQRKSICLNT